MPMAMFHVLNPVQYDVIVSNKFVWRHPNRPWRAIQGGLGLAGRAHSSWTVSLFSRFMAARRRWRARERESGGRYSDVRHDARIPGPQESSEAIEKAVRASIINSETHRSRVAGFPRRSRRGNFQTDYGKLKQLSMKRYFKPGIGA